MDDPTGGLGVKLASAFLGAIMALVFQPPKNQAEFITRGLFSLIAGMVFSDPARDWLKWPDTVQYHVAAAALTAMLSWWLMGMLVRIIGAWKPKE